MLPEITLSFHASSYVWIALKRGHWPREYKLACLSSACIRKCYEAPGTEFQRICPLIHTEITFPVATVHDIRCRRTFNIWLCSAIPLSAADRTKKRSLLRFPTTNLVYYILIASFTVISLQLILFMNTSI